MKGVETPWPFRRWEQYAKNSRFSSSSNFDQCLQRCLYGLLQKADPKHFDFVLNHIDEIKKEGKDACLSGAPKETNPYSGVDGDLWEAGYTASYNKKIKQ